MIRKRNKNSCSLYTVLQRCVDRLVALLVASLANTGTNKSEFVIAMCQILIEKGKGYKHKCVPSLLPTRAHRKSLEPRW